MPCHSISTKILEEISEMNMKRLLALVVTVMMVLALCSCAAKGADTEAFTLKVGFDAEYPPFGFIADDGSYDGFDLALAAEACDRLGWKLETIPIAWDSKDAELDSGNINCIWNGFTINGREDDYTWTVGYYDNSIVMVVLADSGIASLADLAGKTVITQAGSSALTALEEDNAELTATFDELLECADYNSAYMELDSGAVDAIAVDIGVARYYMASKSGSYAILDEIVAYFLPMARTTGTLWEMMKPDCSLDHGFASFIGVLIARSLSGILAVDERRKIITVHDAGIPCDAEIRLPLLAGDAKCSRRVVNGRSVLELDLPAGYQTVLQGGSGETVIRQSRHGS
jgi:polar amino acid transport system substrate-binding protein